MVDLTIVVLTYNHEKWIEETINSILIQNTNYSYKILVSDDASTDNTSSILLELKNKNPEKIELLLRPKNLGAEKNFLTTVKIVDSIFIGFCEGDDTWVGEGKIEQQLNYLNSNKSVSAICGDCHLLNEDGKVLSDFSTGRITADKKERIFLPKEFIEAAYRPIHISSLITYSEIASSLFPDWYLKTPILDTPILTNLVLGHKVFYSPEVCATYRLHSSSITHNRGFTKKYLTELLLMFDKLNSDYEGRYKKSFIIAKNNRIYRYYHSFMKSNRFSTRLKGRFGLMLMILKKSSYNMRDVFYTIRKG